MPTTTALLADIEVAEAADQPHAIELAGLFLEAADEKHLAIGDQVFFTGEGLGAGRLCRAIGCLVGGNFAGRGFGRFLCLRR